MADQERSKRVPQNPEPEVNPRLTQQAKPSRPEEAKPESTDKGAGPYRRPFMKRTDFPYVVTMLFAFFAWAVTHAVDRLIVLPLVKLTQTIEEQEDGHYLTFEFKNITSNVNFRNLTIRILGENEANRFSKPKPIVIGSGWIADAKLFGNRDGIKLEFPSFHPGWRLELTTVMTGGGAPTVHLESADVPTILEPVGLRTALVEWELHIIASLAGLALMSIIVWATKR